MSPSPALSAIEQRRLRVHAAVRELLSEQGFKVSMEAVAARAGCSKQTLYAQFGNKQGLLRSLIEEHLDLATTPLARDVEDPRGTLLAFATQHLEHLCDPSVMATNRLLTAEAHHFPQEAQSLYHDGCDTLQQRLADWIGNAMRQGRLRHDEPHFAAEMLLGMIAGLDLERQRFGVAHRASDEARQRWARFAVDTFLRAFSPDAKHRADDGRTDPPTVVRLRAPGGRTTPKNSKT